MAKLTRNICDFCGGDLGDHAATLSVPVVEKTAGKQDRPQLDSSAFSFLLGFGESRTKTRDFDMCAGCSEGLIRWRHEAIGRLIEEGFVKQ